MFDHSRRKAPSRARQFRARLNVELLEPRNLLSASSVSAVTAQSASDVIMTPNLTIKPLASSGVQVTYTPAQIAQAYGINQITFSNGAIKGTGAGQTIAIVDATYDPNIASDLHTFDTEFGLSDPTLITHTMAPTNQMPQDPNGWGIEISLDVEWAHAMAPGATILLVEASSASLTSLLSAVSYAANYQGNSSQGIAPTSVVSMSWGSGEWSSEANYNSYFTTPTGHSNVSFVASSGDGGSGAEWPSIASNVLSVGGTTLNLDQNNNWLSETGWSGSGGGYSRYITRPAYQNGVSTNSKRSDPDVAYLADPNTGVYVYDSAAGGWYDVGGTSVGAPQWAALTAIVDQGRAVAGKKPLANIEADVYAIPSTDFHDITSGSNGAYKAGKGYDLVTGLGSPIANLLVADLVNSADVLPTSGGGGGSTPTPPAPSPPPPKHRFDLVEPANPNGPISTIESIGNSDGGNILAGNPLFESEQTTNSEVGQTIARSDSSADPTLVGTPTIQPPTGSSTAENTFANLGNRDWQLLTESVWGYRPLTSASNNQGSGSEDTESDAPDVSEEA